MSLVTVVLSPPDFPALVTGTPTMVLPSVPIPKRGTGRIFGVTKNKHSPTDILVGRRIRIFRETDALLVAEQWSDATTGEFSFDYLDPDYLYTIVVYDHTLQYDPEARGPLATVPMV